MTRATNPIDAAPAGPASTAPAVLRLRPVVSASPTADGLHVRGWSSSFTISGGAGLWQLWQLLAARLTDGVPVGQPLAPGASPKLLAVVSLLQEQLDEHDMLVRVPAGWPVPGPADGVYAAGSPGSPGAPVPPPDLARWLESVAPDPAGAWETLRSTRVYVSGIGPVAEAAIRTLTGAGITPVTARPRGGGRLWLAGGDQVAVAGYDAEAGFVLPVGLASEDAATAVAGRLGLTPATPGAATQPPYPLAGLIGGCAAHRLLCAVAGLPDPAAEAASLTPDAPAAVVHPQVAVLVARLDPLRASFHPWLPAAASATGAAGRPHVATADLDAISRSLDALSDPELGVLPAAVTADLPQLPAMLAVAGAHPGVAVTADAARLDATLRAAEHTLASTGQLVAVGTSPRHAAGVALRRLTDRLAAVLPGTPLPESEWTGSPAARRWWKALTLRLAVAASVRVRRLAAEAVHAEITADGRRLAWAVEVNPGDAVGLAALAAAGSVQASRAGITVSWPLNLAGAAPAWRPVNGPEVRWTGDDWAWPSGTAAAEERLQAALCQLLVAHEPGLRPVDSILASEWPMPARRLVGALAAASFAAVTYSGQMPGQPGERG